MLGSVVVVAAIALAVVAVVVKRRIRRRLKAVGRAVAGRAGGVAVRAARAGWRSRRSRAMAAPRAW